MIKMDKVKFFRVHKILVSLVIAILLGIVFWLTFTMATATETASSKKWIAKHPLLSKRLAIEDSNDIIVNFVPLRKAVKFYLSKTGLEYSFYLEYLPTGTSIRSNENNQLAGASLLKLPTIISLYKAGEAGSVDLDKVVVIKNEWLDSGFGDLWKKGAGTKLTLREAAHLALINSDNTAIKTVRGVLGDAIVDNETVLAQLDVDFPYTIDGQSQVSARDYASVLKCLYLSCYLKPENSQEILTKLAQAPDFGRIARRVPDDVKVAHKIGVFHSEVQSDCGIIYVPNRPYLLCVILKAPSNTADQHMQELSGLIYDYISDPSR